MIVNVRTDLANVFAALVFPSILQRGFLLSSEDMHIYDRRRQKIESVVARRQRGLVVVLEDVHDPHNAGAIMRTCDAFGIQTVYFIFEKEKAYNPKRVGKSSSSSANAWLDFRIFRSSKECFETLARDGYAIITTVLEDVRAVSLLDAPLLQEKIALVFGNEHAGVSEDARRAAHIALTIPMDGMAQSLNVSVCAAICLFEISRQRHASGGNFFLPPEDQRALMQDFLKR